MKSAPSVDDASYVKPGPKKNTLTAAEIAKHFNEPLNTAAKNLGICPTYLKKLCRKNGITSWPFRKIKSIEKRISILESAIDSSACRDETQSPGTNTIKATLLQKVELESLIAQQKSLLQAHLEIGGGASLSNYENEDEDEAEVDSDDSDGSAASISSVPVQPMTIVTRSRSNRSQSVDITGLQHHQQQQSSPLLPSASSSLMAIPNLRRHSIAAIRGLRSQTSPPRHSSPGNLIPASPGSPSCSHSDFLLADVLLTMSGIDRENNNSSIKSSSSSSSSLPTSPSSAFSSIKKRGRDSTSISNFIELAESANKSKANFSESDSISNKTNTDANQKKARTVNDVKNEEAPATPRLPGVKAILDAAPQQQQTQHQHHHNNKQPSPPTQPSSSRSSSSSGSTTPTSATAPVLGVAPGSLGDALMKSFSVSEAGVLITDYRGNMVWYNKTLAKQNPAIFASTNVGKEITEYMLKDSNNNNSSSSNGTVQQRQRQCAVFQRVIAEEPVFHVFDIPGSFEADNTTNNNNNTLTTKITVHRLSMQANSKPWAYIWYIYTPQRQTETTNTTTTTMVAVKQEEVFAPMELTPITATATATPQQQATAVPMETEATVQQQQQQQLPPPPPPVVLDVDLLSETSAMEAVETPGYNNSPTNPIEALNNNTTTVGLRV